MNRQANCVYLSVLMSQIERGMPTFAASREAEIATCEFLRLQRDAGFFAFIKSLFR